MANQATWDALFQRIRDHCRARNWYGPDGGIDNTLYRYDWTTGEYSWPKRDRLPTQTFDHPPAAEEQLARTEEMLEFPLPAVLRALYASVANGGFGPGYGILGAVGGYGSGDGVYDIAQGFYQFADEMTLVPLEDNETPAETPGAQQFLLPAGCWPDRLLPLCYWGDAMYDFIDATTGLICQRDFLDQELGVPRWRLVITRTDLALEDWLTRWLDGALKAPQS